MTTTESRASITVNWQKFSLLAIALCGMIALVIFGEAEWSDVSAPFGLIIGYGTANGIGAARGNQTRELFAPAHPQRRATDLDDAADLDDLDAIAAAHRAQVRAARLAQKRRREGA